MAERYDNSWVLLMDKGYQGAALSCRSILATKKKKSVTNN